MSRKVPLSFEEFERRDGRGQGSSEKRGREVEEPREGRRHHHTIRVYCTCCDKEIDLRTVHCGDCCDDNAERRNGGRRRHGNSSTKYHPPKTDASTRQDARTTPTVAHAHGKGAQSKLTFVPEGCTQRAEVTHARSLGAEEAIAQSRALEESEADLIDLSIAPGAGE